MQQSSARMFKELRKTQIEDSRLEILLLIIICVIIKLN